MLLGRCSCSQKQAATTAHPEGGREDFYSRSTFNFLDILDNTTFSASLGNDLCVYIRTFIDIQYSLLVEDR